MTSWNKFRIHYSFNDILVSFLSILIPCIILYEHSHLASLIYIYIYIYIYITLLLFLGIQEQRKRDGIFSKWKLGVIWNVDFHLIGVFENKKTNNKIHWIVSLKLYHETTIREGCLI